MHSPETRTSPERHSVLPSEGLRRLQAFYSRHKEAIHQALRRRLQEEPSTVYRRFILWDPEGQRRMKVYLDVVERALQGDLEYFFADQEEIGYVRATEGYQLEDVFGFTMAFKNTLWGAISQFNAQAPPQEKVGYEDAFLLLHMLDQSYLFLCRSFLITRDEIINRRRNQMSGLHNYAGKVVSVFDEESIWAHANQGIFDIFGLCGSFLIHQRGRAEKAPWRRAKVVGLHVNDSLVEQLTAEVSHKSKPLCVDAQDQVALLTAQTEQEQFKFLCVPIMEHRHPLMALLLLHDQGRPFRFDKFDRTLLFQFAYFTEAVLANCRMVSELASKRRELRSLTGRLISVQEDLRKTIAGEIHDTLTQALTGIGYKALLCQELQDKDPARLEEELNRLIVQTNEALRQSRHIISNLRPKILDDIGLEAALKKILAEFREDEGLAVGFVCPPVLKVGSHVGIALFRILQEALHNIKKHSGAGRVEVSLALGGPAGLTMVISDDGRGFRPGMRSEGMGLLTMRERAEDLGGSFAVESAPGRGATLRVQVPLGGEEGHEQN